MRGWRGVLFGIGVIGSLATGDGLKIAMELLGPAQYLQYQGVLQRLISPSDNLRQVAEKLKANGFLKIPLPTPKTIYPVFLFRDNNPKFDTFTLYNVLKQIGFSYFFPHMVNRGSNGYSIQLEMKALQQIDPIPFIDEMETRGCKVLSIKKYQNYLYTIDCSNQIVPEATPVEMVEGLQLKPLPIGGIWLRVRGGEVLEIVSPAGNWWHPEISYYDSQLGLIKMDRVPLLQRRYRIQVPDGTKYLRLGDLYTSSNIRRGLQIHLFHPGEEGGPPPTSTTPLEGPQPQGDQTPPPAAGGNLPSPQQLPQPQTPGGGAALKGGNTTSNRETPPPSPQFQPPVPPVEMEIGK
jgi:hypothetical protein